MSTAVTTPSVRVLLFARYADLLGVEALEIPAARVPTVRAVVDWVRSLPGGDQLPSTTLAAVNLRQASPETQVGAGDEVALLPPLAGG